MSDLWVHAAIGLHSNRFCRISLLVRCHCCRRARYKSEGQGGFYCRKHGLVAYLENVEGFKPFVSEPLWNRNG
jgi:hypothetical protein